MKQTGVKKYRRTAAMLAATFTALLAVSSFSFVQAEENTEISFPALEERATVKWLFLKRDNWLRIC